MPRSPYWPDAPVFSHQKGPELMLWAGKRMVRNTGFEPVTSAMSRHCSTTELIARYVPLRVTTDRSRRAESRLRAGARQVFFNRKLSLLAHRDILLSKDFLGLLHGMLAKVKNACGQYRIRFAILENIHHVLQITRTT